LTGTGFPEGDNYGRIPSEVPVNETRTPHPVDTREEKAAVIMNRFMKANPELDEYAAGKFAEYILEASGEFGVHPFLIAAIVIKESTVRYKARSRYAYGLMQINWSAHKRGLRSAFSEIQTLEDLIQPRNNILAGTYIFSCYLDSSDGNVSEALAMYLGRNGTRYIKGVMEHYEHMLTQYEKKQEQRITSLSCLSRVA
jgi:soluble lytic murein transglycosylase-like protein